MNITTKNEVVMILIINKSDEKGLFYQKSFYDLGMNVHSCDFESSYELLSKYSFDAVILTDASEYDNVAMMCRKLKDKFPKIPLIMLASVESNELLDKIIKYADNIILPATPLKRIVEIIFEYIRLFHRKDVTDMICGSVRILFHTKKVCVFGRDFEATKTEYSILRYFVNASPSPVSSEEIIKFCFRPGTKASQTNVTSYIHLINRKSKNLFGRALISKHSKGYYKISL